MIGRKLLCKNGSGLYPQTSQAALLVQIFLPPGQVWWPRINLGLKAIAKLFNGFLEVRRVR